jgi:hypothetical protein
MGFLTQQMESSWRPVFLRLGFLPSPITGFLCLRLLAVAEH